MAKDKIQYVCSECGHRVSKWQGKCNKCHAWNSFKEATTLSSSRPGTKNITNIKTLKPIKLHEVDLSNGETRHIHEMARRD